jgi:hypothetical protein
MPFAVHLFYWCLHLSILIFILLVTKSFPMFEALKYVTTPLTLVAFLSIILFYYLRDRNKKQVDMLKEGDTGKKNEALQILLDRYQIDSSNLTPQQKYQLIMEQVRRRDSKFKWAIGASIVLGIVGAISFLLVNATNKLTDIGKATANMPSSTEVKSLPDNTRTDALTPVNNPIKPADENVNSTAEPVTRFTLHENASQGYSMQYNQSNWTVQDNAAAGYGQPSTGFESRQYPNDIGVTITINPWNGADFQNFVETIGALTLQAGIKVTEVNKVQQFLSASGYNSIFNKMNIGRMYYTPSRSLAVDIIYSQSMEGSPQLKEAVAMMKTARFQ